MENNDKPILHKYLPMFVVFVFAITLYFNYVASAGKSAKIVSDKYLNLFTPAPITFLIWGVIYLGLAAFVVWQLLPALRSNGLDASSRADTPIKVLFMVSCVLNACWILSWSAEDLGVCVLLIIGLLSTLIAINLRVFMRLPNTSSNRLFLRLPFGIYLGWVSVATIANISALLVQVRWDGFGVSPTIWAILVVLAGGMIALWNLRKFNNIGFGLAVMWGFVGILIARTADSAAFVTPMNVVLIAFIVGIGVGVVRSLRGWLGSTGY